MAASCRLRAAYTGAAPTAPLDLERRKRRGEEASCEKALEELCERRRRCPCVRWVARITTGDKRWETGKEVVERIMFFLMV